MVNTPNIQLKLQIEKEVEIDGVGMGVLNDGTAYLTSRGLARLCGVDVAAISRLGTEWREQLQKPRVSRIRETLESRGINLQTPYIDVDGTPAWSGSVCTAVLEYYAFDTRTPTQQALMNFRILAGHGFKEFIYTQVGYDPENKIPEVWQIFHDRVSLNYNSLPPGYFGVFKEIADIIITLGLAGLHIDKNFVPDISVGKSWAAHWNNSDLEAAHGPRIKFEHNYPDYFPQAASNPQEPWCYPEGALGEFRRWIREDYIDAGKFKKYLDGQVKARALPPSFSQLAIETYKEKHT